jgi:RNA polymerase sigma-70 factor, ECF subfamily
MPGSSLLQSRVRPQPEDPDGTLMHRIISDDEDAMAIMIHRHQAPLVRYALAIAKTLDTAEDAVQEAFVRLWENRKGWTPGGSVKAHLYQVVKHLLLGQVRHLEVQRRTEANVRGLLTPRLPTPFEVTADEELKTAVRQALLQLPPRRREALVLVRLQGLSLAEAAERMGLSRQTVSNHISMALDDLREALDEYHNDP